MKSAGVIIFCLMALSLAAVCCTDKTPSSPACRRPRIGTETTVISGGTTVVLKVQINPGASQTAYRCEYGLDKSFGTSTADEDAGSGEVPHEVYVRIHSLERFTHYSFRWRAANECGETVGRTDMFTTSLLDFPSTYLSHPGSIDTVGAIIRIHLYWNGMDYDGHVIAYQWQRIDDGASSGWRTTAGVDSTFEVTTGFTEDWRFIVRAMDDDGLVDPAPPSYVFPAHDPNE